MCQALNLNYYMLVKRYHKRLTVENMHCFVKQIVIIATEECDTKDIFVPTSITIGYAWNRASINGTDVLHSIPAIG